MLKNYFKIAFRNLGNNKLYSFINIGGLAVGIAASVLVLLWVQDELSYDSFHKKAENIYRVIAHMGSGVGSQVWHNTPGPIAAFAKREIPEVREAVRVSDNWGAPLFTYQEKKFKESNSAYVDASFFTVFDFPFLKGNPKKPFPNNHSIIITESIAKKYFGDKEALGKVVQVSGKENYTVSGVIKDIPSNSSIQYEIFFPFGILIRDYQSGGYFKSLETDWGDFFYDTYLLLHSNASLESVSKKLTQLHSNNNPDGDVNYSLQPLLNMHLYGIDGSASAMQRVRIFFIVAIVILLIACINYVNLATARATQRAKELGVRKVIGASKSQLFGQFLSESAIIIVMGLMLALVLIQLLIPAYNGLSGKEIILSWSNSNLVLILGITMLATLSLAGIYPALLLSAFQPLQVMKGKLLKEVGNASFRKMLVVVQFTFSIALIISTFIIGSQLNYIQNKQLGYDKENVFTVVMRGDMSSHFESIKTELLQQTGVMGVTASTENLLNIGSSTGDVDWEGKDPERTFIVNAMGIEKDFMEVFNMQLVEGRGFTGSKADSMALILNETAIEQADIKYPIGKRFTLWQTEATIKGVVKDFHFSSIHNKIGPAAFYFSKPEWNNQLYIKTNGENISKAIAATNKIWEEYNPAYPFDYTFLDETFDNMYKADQRTGKLFTYFAAIAILISCLGLFGLVTYTAEQRTKEIGIRKVLGASVSNITLLLSKDFLKLVIFANLIAWPLAWWAMDKWLQDFAYKIELEWSVFAMAGVVGVVIALVTISYQSIKAALANPVDSLRNE